MIAWNQIHDCFIFYSVDTKSPSPKSSIRTTAWSQPFTVAFYFRSVISAGVSKFPTEYLVAANNKAKMGAKGGIPVFVVAKNGLSSGILLYQKGSWEIPQELFLKIEKNRERVDSQS